VEAGCRRLFFRYTAYPHRMGLQDPMEWSEELFYVFSYDKPTGERGDWALTGL